MVDVPKGYSFEVRINGELTGSTLGVGMLNADKSSWLAQITLEQGKFQERIPFNVLDDHGQVTVVICNVGTEEVATLDARGIEIVVHPPSESGLPANETDQQGWNVGYSAAGEVIAVGNGRILDNGETRALAVKVGDTVVFGQYAGNTVKVDGEDLLIMSENDIFGVLE